MGELYGGREAEIGRSLKSKRVQESRDRGSAKGSKDSIRIVRQREDFGVLNCEGLLEYNLHHQSRIVVSSTLALSFYGALVFLLVWADCFKVYTHTQKNTCVVRGCVINKQAEKSGHHPSKRWGWGMVSCTRTRLSRLSV